MFGESATTKVNRGAAILDEKRPGWPNEIILKELSIQDGTRCVLGQIYGSYFRGARELDINAYTGLGFYDEHARYGDLDKAWAKLISERQLVEA